MSDGVYFGLWLFVPTFFVCLIAICISQTKRPPNRCGMNSRPWKDPRCSIRQFRNIVDTQKNREAR